MRMYIVASLFVVIAFFGITWAELKSCLIEEEQPRICFTEKEAYVKPFPIVLNTTMYLREIVDINENEKSISTYMALYSFWKDPGLQVSNRTNK